MVNVVTLFTTIVGVTGLIGGAVGYFAKGRGDSIIAYQAKEIELRDGTIARLEKDNSALAATCEAQKEQIAVLTGLAQGSPQLVKLTDEIKKLITLMTKRDNRLNARDKRDDAAAEG